MDASPDHAARAIAYHERTKHHPNRYARSPGYMDWATQPDPFRTYAGAPRVALPLAADGVRTRYCDLYADPASNVIDPAALGIESLAAFFELALGLTAWKEFGGTRWALRSDPSSGNLHPTEGYAVLAEAPGLPAGLYHYLSRDHCLERRCSLETEAAQELAQGLPAGAFLVGISSIHWREAWKYGERAFRYCQHDAGHVIATLRFAAATLGWSAWLLDGLGDTALAGLLGLDRDEDHAGVDRLDREHPDALLCVAPRTATLAQLAPLATDTAEELTRHVHRTAELLSLGAWSGQANPLSMAHNREWGIIEDVAEATRKPPSRTDAWSPGPDLPPLEPACTLPAATLIRQRRSAVALDGKTSLSLSRFHALLDTLLVRPGVPPFDALPWEPKLHLALLVHRVDGLAPGLYLLERNPSVHEHFEALLGKAALWTRPPECSQHLPLFCIAEGDFRRAAAGVSCNQDIAADGAFSLGMLAEFRAPLTAGAYWYRRLFWEAGVLGQALYLEAEAAGIRATGIGCYFDDAFHQLVGLEGDRFQSLYHFTVGGPVEDLRLVTYPAYAHLERERVREEPFELTQRSKRPAAAQYDSSSLGKSPDRTSCA